VAGVANKDIIRYNSTTQKYEKSSDLTDLELSVSQLSSSVLSIAGDVDTLELTVSQMSASTLPYDANTSTKDKIDEIASNNNLISAGTITAVSGSKAIPSGAKRIFVKVNINNYYTSPLIELARIGGYNTFLWGALGWGACFQMTTGNTSVSFDLETTIYGTKAQTWTTGITVYYTL
jgi:hypothetical protein